jgi:hypothetical protein
VKISNGCAPATDRRRAPRHSAGYDKIVGDGLIAAGRTPIAMSAERSCAAACDGVEHLKLRPGKRVMFMEPAACCTEGAGLYRSPVKQLPLPVFAV